MLIALEFLIREMGTEGNENKKVRIGDDDNLLSDRVRRPSKKGVLTFDWKTVSKEVLRAFLMFIVDVAPFKLDDIDLRGPFYRLL